MGILLIYRDVGERRVVRKRAVVDPDFLEAQEP